MTYRTDRRATLVLEDMEGAEVDVLIGVPLAGLREWDETLTLEGEWDCFLRWGQPVWNLEDADGPIPVETAALERLPLPVTRAIMRGWRKATVEPPAPLPPPSSAGTP
jgi:hypothetical protein